jgi:hypothetical protein
MDTCVSIWLCTLHTSYGFVFYQAFLLEGSLCMIDEWGSQVHSYMFWLSIVVELILVSMII